LILKLSINNVKIIVTRILNVLADSRFSIIEA